MRLRPALRFACLVIAAFLVSGEPGGPLSPREADAFGRIRIHWDSPDGPIDKPFTAGPVDVFVSLSEQSEPIQYVQLVLRITDQWPCTIPGQRDSIPDAWRFDADGCQAGRLCMRSGFLLPWLPVPPAPGQLAVRRIERDPATGRVWLTFIEGYPAPVPMDPTRAYPLLRVRFDHLASTNDSTAGPGGCANRNRTMSVIVARATYAGADGVEYWFHLAGEVLTWNPTSFAGTPPGESLCNPLSSPAPVGSASAAASDVAECDQPVSAAVSSWGRLKAAYR